MTPLTSLKAERLRRVEILDVVRAGVLIILLRACVTAVLAVRVLEVKRIAAAVASAIIIEDDGEVDVLW